MKTSVNIAGVEFRNPCIAASGTFGEETLPYVDLTRFGGVVLKGIYLDPKPGNPPPRINESYSGVFNAVGLEGKGVEYLLKNIRPKFTGTNVIANVCGNTIEEYAKVSEIIGTECDMLEINVSCPNVHCGGKVFGSSVEVLTETVEAVKKVAKVPIIIKLSPNTQDLPILAKACEYSGADAISLVNTFLAMDIDMNTLKPLFARKVAGLSGQAIFPIALRMVWEVVNAVDIPVIGIGGIANGQDAIKMLSVGATAIQIGAQNLVEPTAIQRIVKEIESIGNEKGFKDINEMIGIANG